MNEFRQVMFEGNKLPGEKVGLKIPGIKQVLKR